MSYLTDEQEMGDLTRQVGMIARSDQTIQQQPPTQHRPEGLRTFAAA